METILAEEVHLKRVCRVKHSWKNMNQIFKKFRKNFEENCSRMRQIMSQGKLPNSTEGDFVCLARLELRKGEKLCLRWFGAFRVAKAASGYVFQVEDLHDEHLEEIHISRSKFYSDKELNHDVMDMHILVNETGLAVHRMLLLEDSKGGLMITIHWRGLPPSEDTLEPIAQAYQNIPDLLQQLLVYQNARHLLIEKTRPIIGLKNEWFDMHYMSFKRSGHFGSGN